MNTAYLTPARFDETALRNLKEEASMAAHLTWDHISAKVTSIVSFWEDNYNRLRESEVALKFSIPEMFQESHLKSIQDLIDTGTTLLMVIDKVETDSNPPMDMTASHDLLIKGLCALMITRRAFSPEVENDLLSTACPNDLSKA